MDEGSDYLRNAESASIEEENNSSKEGGISDIRDAEENTFVNSVSGKNNNPFEVRKKKTSFKKAAPLVVILVAIGGFAAMAFAAQAMMPFAVVNRLIEEFNINGISSTIRSDNMLDLQLSASDSSIFDNAFGLTDYQKEALKNTGIYSKEYNGTSTTLVYKKKDGKYQCVVSTGVIAQGAAPANDIREILPEGDSAKFESPACISTQDAMADSEFKTAYTAASKTWRGGNSGWADALSGLAEDYHGYTRSRWFNFTAKTTAKATTEAFSTVARSKIDDIDNMTGSRARWDEEYETYNEETQETTSGVNQMREEEQTKIAQEGAYNKIEKAANVIGKAQIGTNIFCGAIEALMSIQTLASTYQRIQKINLASGYIEAVQRVQAGYSDDAAAMNEYNNRLTTKDEETGKSAMNSAGIGSLMTGSAIDPNNDPDVQANNSENILFSSNNTSNGPVESFIQSVAGSGRGLLDAFKTCNYAKGGLAFASAAITTAAIVAAASNPVGWAVSIGAISVKAIVGIAVKVTAIIVVPQLVNYVILKIGKSMIEDMATEWTGKALGDALVSGGNITLSANAQTGGGSPGGENAFKAFRAEQNTVVAAEAEYQRQIRSPFDYTSQYTFLGSMVYSLVPLANSSGVGSVLRNMSSLFNSYSSKLLPKASAAATTDLMNKEGVLAKEGDCPLLDSIHIQGNGYCDVLFMTDNTTMSTQDYSPADVIEYELNHNQIVKGGENYIIHPDSRLAKYAMYCGQRVSTWGIADANIAESLRGTKSAAKGLLSLVPLASDVMQIIESVQQESNLGWTTGANCVASEENPYWCENKIHQRFLEDQRWLSDTGSVKTDAVTAFYTDYYKENPLDTSPEGILARYSGMTKDDVIATLDLMEGITYLANYDPATRYAFDSKADTESEQVFFEETNNDWDLLNTEIALEPKFISYFDIRNRAAVV
ncbi:hypothetical protein IKF63_02910 [Candidatus Saccharibacteria bacterium]|nr:hypothetical protein [Candidatus Saccharibacteria bacterium]